jgi:hypothetical protein
MARSRWESIEERRRELLAVTNAVPGKPAESDSLAQQPPSI